jgi:hypothetical protein
MDDKRRLRRRPGQIDREMTLASDVAGAIVDQQDERGDPNQRDRETDDKDRVEAIGHRRQEPEGQQRADEHADGIHRSMDTERRPQVLRMGSKRDERVARRGANPLPESIC